MAAYEINLKREVTLKIKEINIIIFVVIIQHYLIPFNIKMHIYSLSFTNPQIINECELPCFYDVQSPVRAVLFIHPNWLFFFLFGQICNEKRLLTNKNIFAL